MRIVQRIRIGFLPVQGVPLRDGSEILTLIADDDGPSLLVLADITGVTRHRTVVMLQVDQAVAGEVGTYLGTAIQTAYGGRHPCVFFLMEED
jgi:hypothetical protein